MAAEGTRLGAMLLRHLGRSVPVLGLTLLFACVPPEPVQVTLELAEQSMAIAEVFETPAPYSRRTLDTTALQHFLERHPEHRSDSAEIKAFYQRRGMQFAWIASDSLSAAADAFIALANVADTLVPKASRLNQRIAELYDQGFAQDRRRVLCDSCATDLELQLTAEFFRFAARKYGGYLKGDLRELDWFIPRGKKDANRLLDSLATGKMDISAYEPVHRQYRLLKQRLQRYHELANEPWPVLDLPEGIRKLEPGDSLPVVAAIRHRLMLIGDLEADAGGELYDSTLVPSVHRFQERHGLHPDGIIGAGFLRNINVPVDQRLLSMMVNMERLRWVPEQQAPDLVLVNIPEFKLRVFDADMISLEMDVVVGKAATRTVIFSDTLSTIVFSPTWTIPPGILRRDILPAIRRDPDYLRKNNMEIIGGSESHPLVRQRPGPNNAMGQVKFLFPNNYSIYFHDTPAKRSFQKEQRAFSNGCIRVSRPADLAEYLLQNEPEWTRGRIDSTMRRGSETVVPLKHKRPVVLTYFTAWVDDQDRLNFREDVYGHDERLKQELFVPESKPL